MSKTVDRCRVCAGKRLFRYLDLGRTPLANAYLAEADLAKPEFFEELCLQVCEDCGLSQLTKVVSPDLMFKHYLYTSSTTQTMRDHFAELAKTSAKAAGAPQGALAIDVASNDGCLLDAFQKAGLRAVGVDPAENLAREANAKGLETVCAYWNEAEAAKIAKARGRAQVITACNVFAHADDLSGFMAGVRAALDPNGLFVIECPYALDFIGKREFDTAYHEHLSYIGVTPLSVLMKAEGFAVVDVQHFPDIHGGTIRVYSAPKGSRGSSARVKDFLAREQKAGITARAPYEAFAREVLANKKELAALVGRLKREKKTLWAYGASAKGNTLMNFFGLKAVQVPAAIDDNPKKWGYYTPGARMRIVGIGALRKKRVDCLLLLAWNFEKEIRRRCAAAGWSGDFLLPVPRARLVPGPGRPARVAKEAA